MAASLNVSSWEKVKERELNEFKKQKTEQLKKKMFLNHIIAGIEKDLKRLSSPTPLLEQVPYNRSDRNEYRMVVSISTKETPQPLCANCSSALPSLP